MFYSHSTAGLVSVRNGGGGDGGEGVFGCCQQPHPVIILISEAKRQSRSDIKSKRRDSGG